MSERAYVEESGPLRDLTSQQRAATRRLVAAHARDRRDEAHLLDVLGLTGDQQ